LPAMKKTKNIPEVQPLRVLILEDNPADAELIERWLRRANIAFTSLIVEGKRAFSKALADFQPQVILSDFKLPRFDGLAALATARLQAPDTPFIFVSGSIGEEMAIETLSLGAADYVFKDNLARLGPAVNRVIEAARLQQEKKETDEKLNRHVEELRLLAEAADDFVQINELDKLYEYLARTVRTLAGVDYLSLSIYEESLQALRPKIVFGLDPFRKIAVQRFRIDPMQMVFYLKDMRPQELSDFVSRRLTPGREGLHGLFNRQIPRSVARALEKLLAIGSTYTMGLSWENQLFGGLTLLFKQGHELKNASQIEALGNLAAVAIKRLQAEKSLRASERMFSTLVANLPGFVYRCRNDRDWTLEYISEGCREITGHAPEEFVHNRKLAYNDIIHPDHKEILWQEWQADLAKHQPFEMEYRIIRATGEIRWVWERGQGVYGPDGALLFMEGFITDITPRQQAKDQLRESEIKYRTLVTQSPDGIFIIDLQGNFLSTNQSMCDGLGYSEEEFLSMNLRDIVPEKYFALHKKRLAEIMEGKSQNDAAEYEVKAKDGGTRHIAILSAPYFRESKLIGFQGIARDITEKKKMEILLRESEEYYRTLVDTSPDAIIIVDAGGRVTFASRRTFETFGIPPQLSLNGISIADFVDPMEIPRLEERMVEILSGRSHPGITVYRLLRYDRQPFWGEVVSAPLRDALGRSIALLLICRDISQRKQAETALRESEEKYRLITENTADTISVLDLNLKFTYVSPSIFRLRGFTVEEALEQTLEDTLTRDSLARIREVFTEEMALEMSGTADPQRSRSLELQEIRKDGSIVWVENSVSFLRDPLGRPNGILAVSKDISERKRAEEQIRYQASLLQNVSDAVIATNPDGGIQSWNHAAETLYGWKEEEVLGKKLHMILNPKYLFQGREQVFKTLNEIGEWSGEIIHHRRNGNSLTVHSSINILRDAAGDEVGMVSVNHDISERKRAEEMLIERDRLLRNLSAQVPGMVYTFMRRTDGTYCIPYSSNAIQGIFGVSPQDVINDASPIFKPIIPEDQPRVIAAIEHSARTLSPWQAEYRVQLPGKPVRWMLGQSEPFRLADGCILWYGFNTDITDRKEAEELIRASLKEKEVLLQEIHHRVKNNLQIISGLLTLQADQAAGKSLDEIFRESQDRIRTIALIHEKLYRSHNLAEIAFDDYLRNLVENLFNSYGVDAGRITVAYDMEKFSFTIEKAIPLGLIVNELVTNALKHAFPAGRRGEIRIGLRGHPDAKTVALKTDSGAWHVVPTCELIVADNGVGLPAGFDTARQKTLGMNLVSMLTKQLQAEIQVKTAPGSEFRLIFPAAIDKSKAKDKPRPGGI
jgi:PAS domain S-box-containing protein